MPEVVSYGARLSQVSQQHPERVAIHELLADGTVRAVTFGDLDSDTRRVANLLGSTGAGPGSLVAVSLPDNAGVARAAFGAWRLGACVLPLSPKLPAAERAKQLALAAEAFARVVTVGELEDGTPAEHTVEELSLFSDDAPADVVPAPALAIGSGGTSGTPKITVDDSAGSVVLDGRGGIVLPRLLEAMGGRVGQVRLVCTPLYHVNGFSMLVASLMAGDPVVLVERFDAQRVLDAIRDFGVQQMIVVPTVLQRLAQADGFTEADLSSLEAVGYGGSPCPEWLPRVWIDRIGATRVYAGYGATESIGKTVLRGDEWLRRPGSSGRPVAAELRVLDEAGVEVPPGVVGEIHMRPLGTTRPTFRYLGAEYRNVTADGFVSLGDLGWVDEDGYLFVADRRADLIISGGANVFPAEVEAALTQHPDVEDAAVIGLPDADWGQRVHALVQTSAALRAEDLRAWCAQLLAPYKRPKTFEFVSALPRTAVGKLDRSSLVEHRT